MHRGTLRKDKTLIFCINREYIYFAFSQVKVAKKVMSALFRNSIFNINFAAYFAKSIN
jgi:hypothetical protein